MSAVLEAVPVEADAAPPQDPFTPLRTVLEPGEPSLIRS